MGMTMTEKILAFHAGRPEVRPGDLIDCTVDFLFANDITAPLAIKEFEKMGVGQVFDPDRLAFVFDHYVPNKDIASAQQCKITRDFVAAHHLPHFYDVGRSGIAHVLLAELGYVVPGDVFVGADSHTCNHGALGAFSTGVGSSDLAAAMALGRLWLRIPESMKFVFHGRLRPWVTGKDLILTVIGEIGVDGARYGAMEFAGDALTHLTMDERFSITNMAVETWCWSGYDPAPAGPSPCTAATPTPGIWTCASTRCPRSSPWCRRRHLPAMWCRCGRLPVSGWTSVSSAPAPMGASKTCVWRQRFWPDARCIRTPGCW